MQDAMTLPRAEAAALSPQQKEQWDRDGYLSCRNSSARTS
jgi:hypothetical protein